MSDVVFVLGAGASVHAGAPLMGNFLDVASDLLRSNAVQNKRAQFELVFQVIGALQRVHSKAQLDLNNIESIFTVLELGKIIQRVPSLDQNEIPHAISALKELIVTTLEVTMKFPVSNNYIHAPKQYEIFAAMLKLLREEASPRLSVSVITFNYDIGVDMAMHCAGLGPDYAIGAPVNPSNPVQLLKLHGSLNWATESVHKTIKPLHLERYFGSYSVRPHAGGSIMVPIGSQLTEYFQKFANGTQVEPEPVIVPPSWNKADYHNTLSEVWAKAAKHLSEAEHIFILGYSLPQTDSFFRHLYALGAVSDTPLRRLEVFNPEASGATETRFRELLGPGAEARFAYHPFDFEKAIGHIKKLFPKRQ